MAWNKKDAPNPHRTPTNTVREHTANREPEAGDRYEKKKVAGPRVRRPSAQPGRSGVGTTPRRGSGVKSDTAPKINKDTRRGSGVKSDGTPKVGATSNPSRATGRDTSKAKRRSATGAMNATKKK